MLRSRSNRKIAGVAGGLARYGMVDPLVLRIVFVVLAFYGGSGILLYGLAWLLLPEDGATESPGQQLVNGRADSSVIWPTVVSVLGLVAVTGALGNGPDLPGVVLLAAVAVAAFYVLRGRDAQRLAGGTDPGVGQPFDPPVAGAYGAYGAYGQSTGTAYQAPGGASGAWPVAGYAGQPERAPWAPQPVARSRRQAPLPPRHHHRRSARDWG